MTAPHWLNPTAASTLRDRFAMAAATGILANPHTAEDIKRDPDQSRLVAIAAYHFADEMMKARELKQP